MGNNKYKILIVEDEANIRSFIKANLETSDYQVLCAETCALGIMMCASHHPDLIVLDLGLPDRDGMSLIQVSSMFRSKSYSSLKIVKSCRASSLILPSICPRISLAMLKAFSLFTRSSVR